MPDNNSQIQMLKQQVETLQAELYRGNFSGSQDNNKYVRFNTRLKVPSYSAAPVKCDVGEIIEVAGKLRICSATNTWTIVGVQS